MLKHCSIFLLQYFFLIFSFITSNFFRVLVPKLTTQGIRVDVWPSQCFITTHFCSLFWGLGFLALSLEPLLNECLRDIVVGYENIFSCYNRVCKTTAH